MLTKSQERRLSALERKYDRAAGPTRTYFADRQEINALVKEGVIDLEHGQHLLDNAKRAYDTAEAARKAPKGPKRQLTPIGAVLNRRRPTGFGEAANGIVAVSDGIGRLFANLGGFLIFLFVALALFG